MSKTHRPPGLAYKKRVTEINAIYEKYVNTGLSNREIWKQYIYPRFGICETTLYNILRAALNPENII